MTKTEIDAVIITSECEECIYSILDESNKSKIMIHCNKKDKDYIWGQCIPCDSKIKRPW